MIHEPKVMRASSFLSFSRSAGSGDSVRRLARAKKRCFSASLEARPASIKSTRTRLALVFSVLARALTRLATRGGSETLWRTDLSVLAMSAFYTNLHQYAPQTRMLLRRAQIEGEGKNMRGFHHRGH